MICSIASIFSKLIPNANLARLALNIYPPMYMSSVKITHISDDYSNFKARLKLSYLNKNPFGVHYGGAISILGEIFSMAIYIKSQYSRVGLYIRDYSTSIKFVSNTTKDICIDVCITEEMINSLKEKSLHNSRFIEYYKVVIRSVDGELIATMKRGLFISRHKI